MESTVRKNPTNIREKYTLGADGKTLTVETTTNANGKETTQTAVLEKQPDEAGEALKKPEQTAAEHYKNVQLLKDVPSSQFIDTMRYFSASLGVRCEHCHVEGHFDSDEKQAKLFARKMISMTRSIDEQTFEGHPEVRCYTCHRGAVKPISMPQVGVPAAANSGFASISLAWPGQKPGVPQGTHGACLRKHVPCVGRTCRGQTNGRPPAFTLSVTSIR